MFYLPTRSLSLDLGGLKFRPQVGQSEIMSAVPSIYKEVHEPGLEWSMTWPALDPYGQKVIGRTLANIKVGYQFRCGYSCGV